LSYADVVLRGDMSALLLVRLFINIINRIKVDSIAKEATIATITNGP